LKEVLNPVQYLTKEDSMDYNIDPNDFKGRIITNSRRGNFNLPRNVSLKIVKADISTPILIQEFSAKGPDFETALSNAQRAKHRYIQTDSLLLIDGNTHLQKGELWRDQNVHLVLRIPVSTTVFIEGTLNTREDHLRTLYDLGFRRLSLGLPRCARNDKRLRSQLYKL
jgi:hypothetical protein